MPRTSPTRSTAIGVLTSGHRPTRKQPNPRRHFPPKNTQQIENSKQITSARSVSCGGWRKDNADSISSQRRGNGKANEAFTLKSLWHRHGWRHHSEPREVEGNPWRNYLKPAYPVIARPSPSPDRRTPGPGF